jgi:hypothetical protein
MSIGKNLEKEWKRFEVINGDVGRKIVEYLRVRFTSPVGDVVATFVETAKTAEVRDIALGVAADAAAKEFELVQMALKLTSQYARQLPLTIAELKRAKAVLEADLDC